MMNRIIATVVAVVIAAALFRLCAFIVDQKHYAIVFELGHINRVISEPGLHFKLPPPFQNVEHLDKRILTIDPQSEDRVQTAEKNRADADRQREVLLAEAYRDAQRIKGDGDARASATYAQAFGANPEFYAFYRSLEAYKQSFRKPSDMLMVDPSSEFFKYMKNPGGSATAR